MQIRTMLVVVLLLGGWLWCHETAHAQCCAQTVYYAPAPAPTTVYYAPAPVTYAPVAHYHTRFRPILGGSVTRVRYRYVPVVPMLQPTTVMYAPLY